MLRHLRAVCKFAVQMRPVILRPHPQRRPVRRLIVAWMLALAMLVGLPTEPAAHEIPARVTVLAFVKPEGRVLHLVLRVPLAAMRDVDFPQRDQDYLDIAKATPMLEGAAATWLTDFIALYEGDTPLRNARIAAIRIELPSDRSFETYDGAVARLRAPPLDATVDLPATQAMLDVQVDYAIQSDRAHFAIEPSLAHLGVRTNTVLRYITPDGAERAFAYAGNPGLVPLDPRWHQAALRFVQLGFTHILSGLDHLLFLLCLVIPVRRLRPLVAIVTSFTVAHSITLAASAMGLAPDALWFPPLIEVLVALSIVYMALENIVGARTDRRWMLAFGFGLVHGFAFSFALRETMQFSGSHLATALVSFNVGVELAQLFMLALAIPVLALLFKKVVAERVGTIILSALVAHTAWHWMLDRGATLAGYQFVWPVMDMSFAASAMRGAIILIVVLGALWGLGLLAGRLSAPAVEREVGGK